MKKILLILTIGLIGCYHEPQSVEETSAPGNFQIEYLFEKDGIKMYRFFDGGHSHYFTTNGETITEQQNGKITYEESIKAKYHMSDDDYQILVGPPGHDIDSDDNIKPFVKKKESGKKF